MIGVPDDKWGETPAALICLLPGASVLPADIAARCRDELADYKQPTFIVVRYTPLPRGMSGKVLKRDLRDEYAKSGSLCR